MSNRSNLEKLALDKQLERLEDSLSVFNIFKVLGIEWNETRHSNTIAFLLDPRESHGLNDYFLKKYLAQVLANPGNADTPDISSIEIDAYDLRDAIVRREYNQIDILVESERKKFVCCIENKVFAAEANDQLDRYKKFVDNRYKGYKKIFIFLTPDGTEPSDPQSWIVSTYDQISTLLEHALSFKSKNIGSHQLVFIENYQATIRRLLMDNSHERQLAQSIYRSHKDALDFIWESIAQDGGKRQHIYEKTKELLKDGPFVLLTDSLSTIRFTTKRMDDIFPSIGDARWTNSRQMIAYQIVNKNGWARFSLLMGPGDQAFRKMIFTKLDGDRPEKWYRVAREMSPEFHTIRSSEPIIRAEEYDDMDEEDIDNRLEAILSYEKNPLFKEVDDYFEANKEYFRQSQP